MRPTKCLIVQPIHAIGLDYLRQAVIEPVLAPDASEETILGLIGDVEAVITRNAGLSAAAIAAAPRLRVISVHGIGTDPVAVDKATEAGVLVTNTPDTNVRSVAEHAITMTLALLKATVESDAAVRSGDWSFRYRARLREAFGLTFGIVGFGNIGQAVAPLASALGMQVLAASASKPDGVFAAAGVERCTLDELLQRSDVVSLHLSLTDGTRGLFGRELIDLMKRGALLVNTARGGLVDIDALSEALADGRLGGAALDVYPLEPLPSTSPLCAMRNVILSPHLAGSTEEALARTALLAAQQVADVLAGRGARHLVNPDVLQRPAGAESAA